MTNQIRKLLIARGFIESTHGRSWHSGIQYGQFKNSIMPAVQKYDRDILNQLQEWDDTLSKKRGMNKSRSEKVGKKKKKPAATDLVIAKNSQNPYPVYQMLLKSEKFTTNELIAAFEKLSEADLRLKSTRQVKNLYWNRLFWVYADSVSWETECVAGKEIFMGFIRRQEERLAIRLLIWQYQRINIPVPAMEELEIHAARLVE